MPLGQIPAGDGGRGQVPYTCVHIYHLTQSSESAVIHFLSAPGSCDVAGHITKGMCKGLDLAHHGLFLLEKGASWAERAVMAAANNIFVIHKLSFETHLTAAPLENTVSLGADVSIFGSRGQFKLDFNLADPLKNVHQLADTALSFFKKLFTPRFSKTVYDKPSEESDFEFSGVCDRWTVCLLFVKMIYVTDSLTD